MRRFYLLIIAIISIAVIAVAVFSFLSYPMVGQTTSVTLTEISTESEIVFRTASIPGDEGTLYEVVFFQTPTCTDLNALYAIPWAVRLGNSVIVEPTNGPLSDNNTAILVGIPGSGVPLNQTRITFSVPDGVYPYTLLPTSDFSNPYNSILNNGQNASGFVTVRGADVAVNASVAYPGKCGF